MIFDQKWYCGVCETTIMTNTVFSFVSSSEYYVGNLLFNTSKEGKKKKKAESFSFSLWSLSVSV